jgi:L-lactate dehydrogenase (cytochrome)
LFSAYRKRMQTPLPTWPNVTWLREQWDGPFVSTEPCTLIDARGAVDSGADAVSVSNYGGTNLGKTPASILALPPVVNAVSDQAEVLFDGEIWRSSNVVRALALEARASSPDGSICRDSRQGGNQHP